VLTTKLDYLSKCQTSLPSESDIQASPDLKPRGTFIDSDICLVERPNMSIRNDDPKARLCDYLSRIIDDTSL
jgi:hypothetical protein